MRTRRPYGRKSVENFLEGDEEPVDIARLEASSLKKLAALCARGEHSTGEADAKMRRWGLPPESRARIIAKLVDNKFIDDERYARYYADDKRKLNHWGRRKIEEGLRQKGIDSNIAASVLDAIPDEEYVAVLQPMLKEKLKNVTGKSDYERSMKALKWAMGRGFSIDQIKHCIAHADELSED